jgi:hypothetical protein
MQVLAMASLAFLLDVTFVTQYATLLLPGTGMSLGTQMLDAACALMLAFTS